METDLRGVLFGVDRALGDHWRLGVLGGNSRTDVTQRARLSSASVDTWSAGLYGGAEAGGRLYLPRQFCLVVILCGGSIRGGY